jgi:diacylglycerol kinase
MKKFNYAFNGIKLALKELSFKVQLICAAITIIAGVILSISYQEWIWVIFCIFIVLILETVNTAIEKSLDIFSQGWLLNEIKIVKDLSAGFVMISVIMSLIIGGLIFIPKILLLI